VKEPKGFALHKSSGQPGQNLVNPVKISIPRILLDLDRKKILEWGKKSLYGALSKSDKTTCAKLKRVTRLSWL
jgi:hypothetical protein